MDLSTTILAIFIGLLAYRKLPAFYRILFFQALVYLVVDYYASTYGNNNYAFNIGSIIEIGLLFLAAYTYSKTTLNKYLLLFLYMLFCFVWCFDLYNYGKNHFANHAYIIGGISITAVYIRILFQHYYSNSNIYFQTKPLLVCCLGIFIYFAGNVPLLSMMHYLYEKDKDLTKSLYQYITVYTAIIRYFLLAIAFWLIRKNRSSSLSTATT